MERGSWYDVRYDGIRSLGSRPFFTDASSRRGATQEMHAYPLQSKEGMGRW
jgi:hypothetical protein